jgi:hypothetical protein
MMPPSPIDFVHDKQNKPLTRFVILQDPENKRDNLQDLENAGVMVSLELWETQACGWWILSRPKLIIREVSSISDPPPRTAFPATRVRQNALP